MPDAVAIGAGPHGPAVANPRAGPAPGTRRPETPLPHLSLAAAAARPGGGAPGAPDADAAGAALCPRALRATLHSARRV
ncbi:hypothetical protein [Streptomyces hydrogenans]|uniref:Uncharacterized protein n=1 Tax=Streptomyces hydrogenans TaxID=1873719 RepID=A0ABQ3PQU2_9ACTN|nr:hypothetical protein GCM10018784_07640 [Streptomyces hydrogenans]GHI27365.1 hypothetical protein Shyd_87360 [Streptomyces hydrogenans]